MKADNLVRESARIVRDSARYSRTRKGVPA